jgi:hypothetical protein
MGGKKKSYWKLLGKFWSRIINCSFFNEALNGWTEKWPNLWTVPQKKTEKSIFSHHYFNAEGNFVHHINVASFNYKIDFNEKLFLSVSIYFFLFPNWMARNFLLGGAFSMMISAFWASKFFYWFFRSSDLNFRIDSNYFSVGASNRILKNFLGHDSKIWFVLNLRFLSAIWFSFSWCRFFNFELVGLSVNILKNPLRKNTKNEIYLEWKMMSSKKQISKSFEQFPKTSIRKFPWTASDHNFQEILEFWRNNKLVLLFLKIHSKYIKNSL